MNHLNKIILRKLQHLCILFYVSIFNKRLYTCIKNLYVSLENNKFYKKNGSYQIVYLNGLYPWEHIEISH